MGELGTNEEFNLDAFLNRTSTDESEEIIQDSVNLETSTEVVETAESTELTEYKEVEEPCVSLTIIGENRLTDTEVFVRRGIKYSIKAFFSAIVLTIMNMFI